MRDITTEIEDIITYVTGENALVDEPNHLDIDLFENFILNEYNYIEVLVEIRHRIGVYIAPSAIAPSDMSTIRKLIALVEASS